MNNDRKEVLNNKENSFYSQEHFWDKLKKWKLNKITKKALNKRFRKSTKLKYRKY